MEVERDGETGPIKIHQNKYVLEMIDKWRMSDCNPASTPFALGTVLEKCEDTDCEGIDSKIYQSIVGALMYCAVLTRPDIAHVVSKLSQFNKHPHQEHLVAAKRVLRYLKGNPKGTLTFSPNNMSLLCYTDADWATSNTDRKSYSGYVVLFANGPIAWESRKQNSVSLSSTEAEYVAMCQGTKEILFLRSLLAEVGLSDSINKPTTIFCDNQGAEFLTKNASTHKRSKHIDIKYHFIRDKYDEGLIDIHHVPSADNLADMFTKCLSKVKHINFCKLLNLN